MVSDWNRMRFFISLAEFLEPGSWFMRPLEDWPELREALDTVSPAHLFGDSYRRVLLPGPFVQVKHQGVRVMAYGLAFGMWEDEPVAVVNAASEVRYLRVPDEFEGAIQSFKFVCPACERDWYYVNCKSCKVDLGPAGTFAYYPSDHMMFGSSSDTPDLPLAKFKGGKCPHCGADINFQFGN